MTLNNLKTQLLDNKWSKSFSNQTVAVNTSKHAISAYNFISATTFLYTCWSYFQWPFSSSSPSIYFLFSYFLLFLKSICLIFKQKNADDSTIYKYFKLLSHSALVVDRFFCVRTLRIFDSFLCFFRQFLSSLIFPMFRLHLKGSVIVSFWSSLPTSSSDLLFRYVSRIHMHWITRDKAWMKHTKKLLIETRKV